MDIEKLKSLINVKILKIKRINKKNLDEKKKSKITDMSSTFRKKEELKLDKLEFIKGINENEKNFFSYNSVKFMPKRLSKKNLEQPSYPIITKSFSPKITNKYSFNSNERFNNIINNLRPETDRINDLKGIKFKNEYIKKFDLNLEKYKKLQNKCDNIMEINKFKYKKYMEKIINFLKIQPLLLFNSIINLEKEENRTLISTLEEFERFIYKLFNIFIYEINSKVEKNNNISKVNRDLENENNINITEIERLKEIVNSEKIKKLYSNMEKVEDIIGKEKQKYLNDKNDYIILINQLTNEIKDLYKLLNKNKEYHDKYIQAEIKIKEMEKEQKKMNFNYLDEINKLNEKNFIANVYIEQLNQKIESLNNEIKENKKLEKKIIEYQIKIKHLEANKNQTLENYLMMKEDFESYIYLKNNKTNEQKIY